jgi:hypothetical protein
MLSHSCLDGPPGLSATIDYHLAVSETVPSRNVEAAIKATDARMCFVGHSFDVMKREIKLLRLVALYYLSPQFELDHADRLSRC